MLRSKAFLKKTKKGTVVKIVKEHYLREDIGCGSQACLSCIRADQTTLLGIQPRQLLKNSLKGHYILPDTNALLHQVDVIEHPIIQDVIILQTVLDELRHLNVSVYTRIRQLMSDPKRRFYVFSNEHHS
jgi:exosome complex exonuclease DIS3/RRP44